MLTKIKIITDKHVGKQGWAQLKKNPQTQSAIWILKSAISHPKSGDISV